jgi:glycosyltransferase involved in cell wall biosynthesis
MVLIYHNITPPEYFVGVHDLLVGLCYSGRRELGAYVPRCDLALGDSEFNRRDLAGLGFSPTGVLPVVPDFSHLQREPNAVLAGAFDDEWTNILFVGRVIPNKRIDDLIRFFHAYKLRFNPRSRLLLVGSFGGFERYLTMLHHLIAELGASDVHVVGQVSDEELVAYYQVADVFLCASEHEGFCVPLVESFYMRVPVIAYAAAAVPATMDGAGVLYTSKDPMAVAALIDEVVTNPGLEDQLLAGQDAALERLRARDFAGTLLQHIDSVLAAPPKPHPRVAPDFWDQFRRSDWIEELRLERPALFKALPRKPDGSPARDPMSGPRETRR